MKKIQASGIIVTALVIVWLTTALVRVENQRYAMVVGLCKFDVLKPVQTCLESTQTRTAWYWHLVYALTGLN